MYMSAGRQPITSRAEGIANVKALRKGHAWHVRGQGS